MVNSLKFPRSICIAIEVCFVVDVRTTEQQGDFPEVQTPPQTPDVTKTPIPLDGYVETPLPSLRDDAKPMEPTSLVNTPDLSVAAGSLRTIDDFMRYSVDVV